jgi:hypothetical protein
MEDPKKMLQDANGYLHTAQNGMFSGKNAEAVELLNKADELGQILKQLTPGDFQVTSLFQKIEKMRSDLERKGVVTRPGENAGLPFEVQSQLNRVRDLVIKKELEWARRELDNYYSRFAGPMTNIPEIKEIKNQLEKLEEEEKLEKIKKAEAEKINAQAVGMNDDLCFNWEMKLQRLPYFDGTSQSIEQLLFEKENFSKARALFAEYEQVVFPGQKSISLESLAYVIKQRLQMFPVQLSDTAKILANEVVQRIESRILFLNNDITWKSDPSQNPYIIGKNEFDEFSVQIREISPLFDENSGGLEGVNLVLKQLVEVNDRRKMERSKRITMKPEAITGDEAEAPKAIATQALLLKQPDAKILKVAITKMWEMKRTEDWADTSRTQWVIRHTNETTAQIAALLTDESCKLFTLHVEKELQADGSYSQLRSHIMFEELADRSSFE